MKQKRYSEEQIIYALKQVDAGETHNSSSRPFVPERKVCSQSANWEKKEAEAVGGHLTLDKHILQEVCKGLKPAGRQELVKWTVESFD